MAKISKYLKEVVLAAGKLVFGLYLSIIAVFGGAFIAEFVIYHLSKSGVIHLPNESNISMQHLYMLLGLFIGSPIIVYVIKMYIPKTRNEKNKV